MCVGRGGTVGVEVGVGWTVGAGVGSACWQARRAAASARLTVNATARDAVLGGAEAGRAARTSLRMLLKNEVKKGNESIA